MCSFVLGPIGKFTSLSVHFLIGLSTSAQVKPGNEANGALVAMAVLVTIHIALTSGLSLLTAHGIRVCTLLIMGRYYNKTMCHYWDMSVK